MKKKPDNKTHANTATREDSHEIDVELVQESAVTSSGEGETGGTARGAETPEQAIKKDTVKTPKGDMEEARKFRDQIASLNEKHLRLLAEYENYRKRTAREMECVADVASERLLLQFLPILDNLDRATEHRNDKTTLEEYVKGIALIEEQLRKALAQIGLKKMDVVGERFDPEIHDAVFQIESEDHESGIIVSEVEKGYILNGKVIRHPKVAVSK